MTDGINDDLRNPAYRRGLRDAYKNALRFVAHDYLDNHAAEQIAEALRQLDNADRFDAEKQQQRMEEAGMSISQYERDKRRT